MGDSDADLPDRQGSQLDLILIEHRRRPQPLFRRTAGEAFRPPRTSPSHYRVFSGVLKKCYGLPISDTAGRAKRVKQGFF